MSTLDTMEKPEVTSRVREKATVVKDDLRELGRTTREVAKEKAQDYLDQGKRKYGEVEDQLVHYVQEKPVKSILIAAGAGLALGLLFFRR